MIQKLKVTLRKARFNLGSCKINPVNVNLTSNSNNNTSSVRVKEM